MYVCMYIHIYIYIYATPPKKKTKNTTFFTVFSYPSNTHPEAPFWQRICCHICLLEMQKETLGRWEEPSFQSIWFEEKCCYRKMLLTGYKSALKPRYSLKQEPLLLQKISCVEGCNTSFNEAQPSSHFSCMTMVFRFLMKYIEVTE